MCAIAGILGLPFDSHILDVMLTSMLHRGPDGTGTYMQRECCLLHSRLAIIDPAGGAQPMHLHYAGEDYVIAYNGELYNTNEVRRELERNGHEFLTQCDTEVVLHAYAQWKDCCVEKFNGIFAFAVWEKGQKRLFLARDRMGVKPLFYTAFAGGLLFSSEMKTILTYPGVPRQLDAQGAAQILLLGPGRIPGSGVLKNIKELMPGCCGYYSDGKLNWWRYWKLRDREHTDDIAETAARVRYLINDAIRRQMVSDVSIGTFLSGGLDSSIISAVCAKEMESRGEHLNTFSLDYLNNDKFFVPGKFQPESDNAYIHLMEQEINPNQHWTVLSPEDLLDEMRNATVARDLPGMGDVDFSLLAFCRSIRKEVKMATPAEIKGSVEFKGVDFSYAKNRKIIDNVSFSIEEGHILGLVGHTGAGKSTIANLIIRLYDCDEGEVLIDGINVKDLSFSALYDNIAIVSQETYLFIGTILDNIRYAKPEATYEDVIRAAKCAGAHDFIIRLPDGYNTRIGFGYKDLSGGERQRISIARAILRDPKILILDEATAAMDTETEKLIQNALSVLTRGKTTIMIAHRLSTLRDADKLIVIEHGKVAEEGTHKELLDKEEGVYKKLYTLQAEALKNAGITE